MIPKWVRDILNPPKQKPTRRVMSGLVLAQKVIDQRQREADEARRLDIARFEALLNYVYEKIESESFVVDDVGVVSIQIQLDSVWGMQGLDIQAINPLLDRLVQAYQKSDEYSAVRLDTFDQVKRLYWLELTLKGLP